MRTRLSRVLLLIGLVAAAVGASSCETYVGVGVGYGYPGYWGGPWAGPYYGGPIYYR
jgi:hypothetical protein